MIVRFNSAMPARPVLRVMVLATLAIVASPAAQAQDIASRGPVIQQGLFDGGPVDREAVEPRYLGFLEFEDGVRDDQTQSGPATPRFAERGASTTNDLEAE